jgi:prepilin-type N-terminal cleavage/methylation domain-containing protein
MYAVHGMKRRGFTLVELMLVILVSVLMMGTVVGLLYTFVLNYEENSEYSTARQRGQMAFALLSRSIAEAGLGISSDGLEAYIKGISPDLADDWEEDSGWKMPVYVCDNADGEKSRDLYVVYALPSGLANMEEKFFADSAITIDLTSEDKENICEDNLWLAFPSAGALFKFNRYMTSDKDSIEATYQGVDGGTLPLFDELHFLRLLRATVENGQFVVRYLDVAEDPPEWKSLGRVEGIEDMVFSRDLDDHIVTTYVLGRGDVKHDKLVTPETVDGWPDEFEIPDRHYRISAHASGWRLRN